WPATRTVRWLRWPQRSWPPTRCFKRWRRCEPASREPVEDGARGRPRSPGRPPTVARHPRPVVGSVALAREPGKVRPGHEPGGDTYRRGRASARGLHPPPADVEPVAGPEAG